MEPQHEQIAPEIIQAIVAKASEQGLSVNDYLMRLLELKSGQEEGTSLSGTPFEEFENFLGVFDSREPYERPEIKQDAFTQEVITDLERQGLKIP